MMSARTPRPPVPRIDRRHVIGGAVAASLAPLMPAPALSARQQPTDGLARIAASRGLFYGIATQAHHLDTDAAFADLVARESGCLVPEWDMKWKPLETVRGQYSPSGMDRLVRFATTHGQWLRGHTLLWHESLPPWFDAEVRTTADWDRVIVPYARYVAGRWGARLRQWDVVNEGLNPQDGRPDQLRDWRLARIFGADYIPRAFALARRLAPRTRLFYNDYGLEYDNPWFETRRTAIVRNLERWRRQGVPIDGFGLQAHLTADHHALATAPLRRFLAEIAALGLEIVVTELDVSETRFDRPLAARDQAVADETARFLEIALGEPAVSGVLTWGLSDRFSWLKNTHDPRNRGLPYDDALSRKPMWNAIARALAGATARPRAMLSGK